MNTPHVGRVEVVAPVMLVASSDYLTGGQRLFIWRKKWIAAARASTSSGQRQIHSV